MANQDFIIFILCVDIALLLLLAALLRYLVFFSSKAQAARQEMDCAPNWDRFVYWHRQLQLLHLSVIPGLSPKRICAFCRLFYRGKYTKKQESDGLSGVMLPSVLGICICAVCLAGSSFAWFTASVQTPPQSIQSAQYIAEIYLAPENSGPTAQNMIEWDDILSLIPGEYTLYMRARGNATTGFCTITLGNDESKTVYHTQQFQNEAISITLIITKETKLQVIPQWGSSANDGKTRLEDGGRYSYPNMESSPTETTPPETELATPPASVSQESKP